MPRTSTAPRNGGTIRTVLIALAGLAVVGVIASTQARKAQQDALAEADRLYPTDPAGAVSKYKEG